MLPAGIVADSRPRNAQSVSAATAGTLVDSARSPVSATVKCVGVESHHPGHADERERQQLQERGHDLDPPRRPHADDVDGDEHPHGSDRRGGGERAGVRELGNESGQVADEGHRERAESRPDRDPVAPRDEKGRKVAEGAPGVGVRVRPRRDRAATAGRRPSPAASAPPADTSQPIRLTPPNRASDAGRRKMPEPIMLPMTRATAIQNVRGRGESLFTNGYFPSPQP